MQIDPPIKTMKKTASGQTGMNRTDTATKNPTPTKINSFQKSSIFKLPVLMLSFYCFVVKQKS